MTVVLDASALIALAKAEAGADVVASTLMQTERADFEHAALLSTVNLCELYEHLGGDPTDELIAEPGLILVVPFATAKLAAQMRAATQKLGLGIADRACLSLAKHNNLPVLTADAAWTRTDLGVDVQLIRQHDSRGS